RLEVTTMRLRSSCRPPAAVAADRHHYPSQKLGSQKLGPSVAERELVMRLPDRRKRPKLGVRTPSQKVWPRHRRWVKAHGCCVPCALTQRRWRGQTFCEGVRTPSFGRFRRSGNLMTSSLSATDGPSF